MTHRRPLVFLVALAVLAASLALLAPARGDDRATAQAALTKAIERGQELFGKRWSEGGKPCAECHGPGPNKLRSTRLKAYPKWDKTAGKVITGQQKLNQMIAQMARGTALDLGSDDLNALEAYVSSLR